MELINKNHKISIIGLGYVGLPLAVEFSKKYNTIGYDINKNRVDDLRLGIDKTKEVTKEELVNAINTIKNLHITDSISDLKECNIHIITVPTPIDKNNNPDLTPLIKASEAVGEIIKKGDIIIYESTVFPGATEEICMPILEKKSNLKFNSDFFLGYSPERINPGDKKRTVKNIIKVTSGSTAESSEIIDDLYKSIIEAGTHKAPSIKVAEAAKVIENSQRDINIAFVNELAKIFNVLNIDTNSVLEAASTKWNFLNFKPGLVGGHCIGVDPYYLAQKAQEVGYHPEIILSGRRVNDSMGEYVASRFIKLMIKKGLKIKGSNILILGITFKENCPDIRNTRVIDIINSLKEYQLNISIYDPIADIDEVEKEYGLHIDNKLIERKYDGVVLAVAHDKFIDLKLNKLMNEDSIIYDVKGFLKCNVDETL